MRRSGRRPRALRANGVDADVVATTEPDARGYDVAHVFGIFDPDFAAPQLRALRACGVPVVVSPIWWDRTAVFTIDPHLRRALSQRDAQRARRSVERVREREGALCRTPGRGALRRRDEQARLLQLADCVLPASEIEGSAYANVLHAAELPAVVAKYGVDAEAFAPHSAEPRAGVVCVGRIETLKNQAMLLLALHDLDIDVTLVGRSYDPAYLALCRRWATPRTRFVDVLDDEALRALLARSAVHVLPSWGDLPGFASLEAACSGARVVAGTRGSEREYLGPDAGYADALDVDGIRRATMRALAAPARTRDDALDARMRELTWERAARSTLDAYRRAVAARA